MPIVVAPSVNVTEPDGVPLPGAVADTVAVNVTDCPTTDGEPEPVTAVAVAAWPTAWAVTPLEPVCDALPP